MQPLRPALARSASALLLGALTLSLGCAMIPRPVEGTIGFSSGPEPRQADAWHNWPIPADEFVRVMTTREGVVKKAKPTASGTSGAMKMTVRMEGLDQDIKIKWKDVPSDLDGINNAPRKEVAAYEVQKLFLDPEFYVVPPSLLRCVTWPEIERKFLGSNCNLGVISQWLEDVTVPPQVYDPERFTKDRDYAYFMGVFNLLTYLVDHKDGRAGNFLVNKQDNKRVYAIDNGVAFQRWPFYNWFVPNWNQIRLPGVPRSAVERLRKVTHAQVEALGVVAQLELDSDGMFRNVKPGQNLDPSEGAKRVGNVLQFGLEDDEIDTVWERIQELIARVDSGDLPAF